jgi:hypothetical protein
VIATAPLGLCGCGCGRKTSIAKETHSRYGHIKGQPVRYVVGHANRKIIPLETRFWSKVDRNGPVPAARPELGPCFLWTANRNEHGYGKFFVSRGRGQVRAHRIAWELIHGPLGDGIDVLHKCDNPPCVNEAHLSTGTHVDNMRDMSAKGRAVVPRLTGEAHPNAKLTNEAVAAIRRDAAAGATRRSLAARHGVSQGLINKIVHGEAWR